MFQSDTEFVPKIVEICTSIVEARGLEVIGIYRVPGNTAAISQLTESVNKGFLNINSQVRVKEIAETIPNITLAIILSGSEMERRKRDIIAFKILLPSAT